MTKAHERTRSVMETGDFLERISKDNSLPDAVRWEAKQLLRHCSRAEDLGRAEDFEVMIQREIARLVGAPKAPSPTLTTWPSIEPFFCAPLSPNASEESNKHTFVSLIEPAWHSEDNAPPNRIQILGHATLVTAGCFSLRHWWFASRRIQVLARARVILGSDKRALEWFSGRIRSLDMHTPCDFVATPKGFILVMDVLTRIEHGIF
ncbi:TPA: BPSL0761 family protein [Pseudomonas aeruginosa]